MSKYMPARDAMLVGAVNALKVRINLLKHLDSSKSNAQIFSEVELALTDLIEAGQNKFDHESSAWGELNRLQEMMALVEPANSILAEMRLRLDDAVSENASSAPKLAIELAAAEARALETKNTPPTIREQELPSLRLLLLDIICEAHRARRRKFYSRPLRKSAIRRIVSACLISAVLFILPYWYIYYKTISDPIINSNIFIGLPLYTALTSGLFGAYFSRLLYIQSNGVDMSIGGLRTAAEYISIVLRGCVGMCGALVVFFILRAGIIDGQFFPKFTELTIYDHYLKMVETTSGSGATDLSGLVKPELIKEIKLRQILPSPQLALLAVWCFLAGFSERLVPSILASTEKKLDSATNTIR